MRAARPDTARNPRGSGAHILAALLPIWLLAGCALEPGKPGIPIIPIVMAFVGLAFLAWGITLTPWFAARRTDALSPHESTSDDEPPR